MLWLTAPTFQQGLVWLKLGCGMGEHQSSLLLEVRTLIQEYTAPTFLHDGFYLLRGEGQDHQALVGLGGAIASLDAR